MFDSFNNFSSAFSLWTAVMADAVQRFVPHRDAVYSNYVGNRRYPLHKKNICGWSENLGGFYLLRKLYFDVYVLV